MKQAARYLRRCISCEKRSIFENHSGSIWRRHTSLMLPSTNDVSTKVGLKCFVLSNWDTVDSAAIFCEHTSPWILIYLNLKTRFSRSLTSLLLCIDKSTASGSEWFLLFTFARHVSPFLPAAHEMVLARFWNCDCNFSTCGLQPHVYNLFESDSASFSTKHKKIIVNTNVFIQRRRLLRIRTLWK